MRRVKKHRFYENRADWRRIKTAQTHVLGTGRSSVLVVDYDIMESMKAWSAATGLTVRQATSLACASFLAKTAPSRPGRPTNRAHLRFRLD